jgi:hypothetical protein
MARWDEQGIFHDVGGRPHLLEEAPYERETVLPFEHFLGRHGL